MADRFSQNPSSTTGRNPQVPDHTIEDAARAAGANVKVLWQSKGPQHTAIKFMEGLLINQTLCIVQTFDAGGWEVLTAGNSGRIDDTIADVLNRCKVPVPTGAVVFYVYRDGKYSDTMGTHLGLKNETEAAAKYRALHPEIDPDAIRVSRHKPEPTP